jgi:fatty-acyl-CoA synthase
MTLFDVLDVQAAADPGRLALIADGVEWTRGDLVRRIVDSSRVLRHRWELAPNDRVGYLGANRPEELVLFFALARIGCVFVPINARLATTEMAAIVAHAELKSLVVDGDFETIGVDIAMRAAVGTVVRSLVSLDEPALEPDEVGHRETSIGDDDVPVLIAYTSGTTGEPKGAVHTQISVEANTRASVAAHDLCEDDRVLAVLPLFHVGGLLIQTVPALLCGAAVILHPRFDAGAWLAAVERDRPTLSLMVPATMRAVLTHPAWATTDLSSLRVVMAGSSIIPRAAIDAFHARGVPLGQVYGATETGPVTIALPADEARAKAGSAGWPCFEHSIRLVDPSGRDVADGEIGEILVRAPNLMRNYWRMDAGASFRDDWFATGDLARRDDDGCYEVVGRSRDLIISGGENIYPSEVEDVIAMIDGVAEVAVLGIADERWGEVPVAFVVPRPGRTDLDEAGIVAAFDGRLARFKHPKRVVFVDALPRNAMGKVLGDALRTRLSA